MNRILEEQVFCFHMAELKYPKKSHRKIISLPIEKIIKRLFNIEP
jgi:hypothetical protein